MATGNNERKTMATCKITGLPLPANLYSDPLGRPNKYRYRLPNGKFKPVNGDYAHACAVANAANDKRDTAGCSSKSILFWVNEYIKWMEAQNPGLVEKRGWRDRATSLRKFANETPVPLAEATVGELSTWWDGLTFDQQHNRRSNYSQFFQWAMSKGAAKCNPFNTSDAVPHLIKKKKPKKARLPLKDMEEFWIVYRHAEDFVQIGMIISLTTTMREGDIADLLLSKNIVDGKLRKTINKSANQRGAMAASHLEFDLKMHAMLGQAIKRARELAFKRSSCPTVLSKHKRSKPRKDCVHRHQASGENLSKGFTEAVRASGHWDDIEEHRTPPTFHEVRGLIIDLLLKRGMDIKAVMELAAHTDPKVTSGYTANHPPEFREMGIVVNDEVLK